jgi:photosynthetic reaction center cytochrome c subunit
MKFWSRRPILAVVAMTLAWLVSVTFAASGAKFSTPVSDAFHSHPNPTSALGGVLSASTGAAFAQAGGQTPVTPQMSEAAFKNIQVLKGIPVDEFMGTMGLFSAALSVCCGDCHTGAGTSNPKWEDDPPRKRTARRMVQMVNAINKENFGGRQVVTCWTCHRGNQRPTVTPAIDRIYGDPILEPPDLLGTATSGVPTVDQIFDKYIQAVGGAARLAALTSFVGKGTSIGFGEVGSGDPFELYAKAPNQLATVVHQREGDLARTYDGTNAYVQLPLTVVEQYPLTASALEGAKLDAQLPFPARIKQLLNNWRVSFPTTIEDHEVNVVQGTGAQGLMGTFYFDKQSGLLLRMVRYVNSAMGRVPTQIDYSDYRPVAGVMIPFKWTYGWVSGRDDFTMTDVQPNAAIDAAKFGRPVQRAK